MAYVIHGTNGDDDFATGNPLIGHDVFIDIIFGYDGDDYIAGLGGNDILHGMDGDDVLVGGYGADILYGGDDDDDLFGGVGADRLFGGTGNDQLYGGKSADKLHGDAGADVLDGGTGKDELYGGAGNDTYYVNVAEGDEVHEGIIDGNLVDGSAASGTSDTVFVNGSGYTLTSFVERGYIVSDGDADLTGNDGNNHLFGNAGKNTLDGGAGRDDMSGGEGDDTYLFDMDFDKAIESVGPGGGYDKIIASSTSAHMTIGVEELRFTNDVLHHSGFGSIGDNLIVGSIGVDHLWGSDGDDTLLGGGGDDWLRGEDDDDRLTGGAGADFLDGGAGFDWARYAGSTAVSINLETDTASGGDAEGDTLVDIEAVSGSSFDDVIWGDWFENELRGGKGNDRLRGGMGDDELFGGDDADRLHGGDGSDIVDGGSGEDLLNGNAGNDELTGGAGADTFVFNYTIHADTIADFEDGTDTLQFKGYGWDDLTFSQTASGALITVAGGMGSVLLSGIDASQLSMADLVFV